MRKITTFLVVLTLTFLANAQETPKKVLFIGNSYTYVNELPQMVKQMAENTGFHLDIQQVTPGGATFSQQCNSTGAMDMIGQGGWDAVVLQAQSQEPSFPWSQFTAETYPYACQLANAVYEKNDCAEVVFYMTWGRKNGDSQNAPYFDSLATYAGMDDLLCARYTYMAQQNRASVSPVGKVWRKLRADHPEIELYQSDESHPSLAGSYAAACTFYAMLFRANPQNITTDLSVNATIAQTIRETAKAVVYDSLWRFSCHTFLDSLQLDDYQWQFSCLSAIEPETCRWNFGDGTSSTELNVTHTYSEAGTYMVELIAGTSCHPDTNNVEIVIAQSGEEPVGIAAVSGQTTKVHIYPNPASESIVVSAEEPVELRIVDMKGHVYLQTEPSVKQKVSLTEIPEGVYLVVTNNGLGIKGQVQKIVIKH